MKYLLSRATHALYLNMFGYDDEELNAECMRCVVDRSIATVITLDKTQAGGVHEKLILNADVHRDPVAFNTHVVVGQSATHQISHTRGGIIDGGVGFEGSANWSAAGEGTFVVKGHTGGPGYKAQTHTRSSTPGRSSRCVGTPKGSACRPMNRYGRHRVIS
jgi:hypothetical protein